MFHINPGKLFWQEVTDHYISKLFTHFYSTLFFSALSPHPIHLKMTVGIASILKSWKTGQSQCHKRPLFFSGQKCLTNLNLITMSWIRLWESIRHFLPKTTMRIHTQAKKKKDKRGGMRIKPGREHYCKAVLAFSVHLRGGKKKDVSDWQMIAIKVRTNWPFYCGRAIWEGIINLSAFQTETQLFLPQNTSPCLCYFY